VIVEFCITVNFFLLQRELELITQTLIDSIVVDEVHNVASTQARLSKERLPSPQTYETGQWYLQPVPDSCSEKKCQAFYSKRSCQKRLPTGVLFYVLKCEQKSYCNSQVPGVSQ